MQTTYEITHRCGHDATVHLGDVRTSQRDSRLKLHAARLCEDCRDTDAGRRVYAEQTAAVAQAEAEGLPALAGSPKQVSWAEVIRREHLDWFAHRRDGSTYPGTPATADLTALRSMTEARFWINFQGSPWKAHLRAQELTSR